MSSNIVSKRMSYHVKSEVQLCKNFTRIQLTVASDKIAFIYGEITFIKKLTKIIN